jgi:uncharacterized protein DUF6457
VHEWLATASEKLARMTDRDRSEYELDQESIDDVLELARVAAHESGERTNAPLVCYLAGLAHERGGGELHRYVDELIAK